MSQKQSTCGSSVGGLQANRNLDDDGTYSLSCATASDDQKRMEQQGTIYEATQNHTRSNDNKELRGSPVSELGAEVEPQAQADAVDEETAEEEVAEEEVAEEEVTEEEAAEKEVAEEEVAEQEVAEEEVAEEEVAEEEVAEEEVAEEEVAEEAAEEEEI